MSDLTETKDGTTETDESAPVVGADYQSYRNRRDAERAGKEPPPAEAQGDGDPGDEVDEPTVDENDALQAAGEHATGDDEVDGTGEEAPAETAETETDQAETEEQEASGDKPKKKRLPWRQRKQEIEAEIQESTRKRYDEKRRRDALAAEIANLESRKAALASAPADTPDPKPTPRTASRAAPPTAPAPVRGKVDIKAIATAVEKELGPEPKDPDSFDNYEGFLDAKFQWRDQRREKIDERSRAALVTEQVDARLAADRNQAIVKEAAREQATRITTWLDRVTAFKSEHADYDQVIKDGENLPLHVAVKNRIVASEGGPAVLYHLCSHPTEAEELAGLPADEQLERVGILKARLGGASNGTSVSPPGAPISRAKPPIKTVRGTRQTSTVPLAKRPYQDYRKKRDEQRRQGRGMR